ncbi:MAG: type II secretion system F family protein, partial [Rhodospirillales bacterium]|nr:type II secretion system F family protein [Rhodospirillales bacterium]
NRVLVASLAQVRQGVQDGNPLSTGMKDSGEFPSLVVRMVKIGEDSGNLTETLGNVTSFYDTDVNDTVDALIASIEPALTVVGGGLMAWIVAAVMGPMYDSFSKLGG